MAKNSKKYICQISKKECEKDDLYPIALLRCSLKEQLKKQVPDCDMNGYICSESLYELRANRIEHLLKEDKGDLNHLDEEVVKSFEEHELISENVTKSFERGSTLGGRMADRLARFGGSWPFIFSFIFVLAIWMIINAEHLFMKIPFDPYPYILLNLVLSCLAAIQAPVILMSQNREAAKDRMRSEYEYKINLKAELEIRQMHAKIDQFMKNQWERLLEIQQIQVDLAADVLKNNNHPNNKEK